MITALVIVMYLALGASISVIVLRTDPHTDEESDIVVGLGFLAITAMWPFALLMLGIGALGRWVR